VFQSLANCFRIPELRKKILFTLAMLVLFRVGAFVPIPMVDPGAVRDAAGSLGEGALGLVNMFSGGALRNCSLLGLGIMPYISASIIFQLLATVIPPLERLQKEGEAGQRKINQYTRYAAVVLCLIQSVFVARMVQGLRTDGGVSVAPAGWSFKFMAMVALTGGTLFLMWIGEQIQEHGVGNGISLIIMTGIIARMPPMMMQVWELKVDQYNLFNPDEGKIGILGIAAMGVMYVMVVVGVVLLHLGQRRIPIQTGSRMRGRMQTRSVQTYIPLRVAAAGVIPIIFAQSLLTFPGMILRSLAKGASPTWGTFWMRLSMLFHYESFSYVVIYVALIFFFCFFWTAVQFNPVKIAEDLKEHGSFIKGIRAGRNTSAYFERVMTRMTLAGGAFISIIAILPLLIQRWTDLGAAAYIYGGTGILIVVGVALDLVQKIESHLLNRHYDGFMKGGRIRGRGGR
jgi:preprotein translocase subunit SecY